MTRGLVLVVSSWFGFCGCVADSAGDAQVSQDSESGPDSASALPVEGNSSAVTLKVQPRVLLIGDSISVGYTKFVKEYLAAAAEVVHAPGNNAGTTLGIAKLDEWLGDQHWDLIHFNWGLHDLKRVKEAGTSKNSNDPNDPYQADVEQYSENLRELVSRLQKTGALLVFATTTPFPAGVKPYRDPQDALRYNEAALRIMREADVAINDLYTLALPNLAEWQQEVNVHFKEVGSRGLGAHVALRIRQELDK
jgi:acyl-CoA thioesterase-1